MIVETLANPTGGYYIGQFHWELSTNIEIDQINRGIASFVNAHDVFRSRFVPCSDGVYHVVDQDATFAVEIVEEELEYFLKSDIERGFDLHSTSWFRVTLLKQNGIQSNIVLTMHHALYDGWCLQKIKKDLVGAIVGRTLEKTPSFKKLIEYINGQDQEECHRYWQNFLSGYVPSPSFNYREDLEVSAQKRQKKTFNFTVTSQELNSLAKLSSITRATIAKAAWALTMKHYMKSKDIVIGTVVSGRDSPVRGIENMMGMLIATIPNRIRFDMECDLLQWLQSIQYSEVDSYPYAYAGMKNIQKFSGNNIHGVLFNTVFVFQNSLVTSADTLPYPFREAHQNPEDELGNFGDFDILLDVYPNEENLCFLVDYKTSVMNEKFADSLMNLFQSKFKALLSAIKHGGSVKLRDVDALQREAIDELFALGTGEKQSISFPLGHSAFEYHAKNKPNMVAIEHNGEQISYGELHSKSNNFAATLHMHRVGPGDYVPLITERSIDMVIGILGIVKAGAAYIPIDSSLPTQRIVNIIELSRCKAIAYVGDTIPKVHQQLPEHKFIKVEHGMKTEAKVPTIRARPEHAAYVIFTSGSTGTPKGVIVSHSSLSNLANVSLDSYTIKPGTRVGQLASLSFDVCVLDIFRTLSNQGTLVLRDAEDYFKIISTVDTIDITPTALSKMDPKDYPNLKLIHVGGESCNQHVINKWARKVTLVNAYGPTEITVTSSEGVQHAGRPAHIGGPLPNTTLYLVDEDLALVHRGFVGELLVGGSGVAQGYLHRPDLTLERFIPNPFQKDGSVLYRTGDLCRWNSDGNLIFIGRIDDMIKVKGYRVEISEISSCLSQHPLIESSYVLVHNDNIVSFYTPASITIESVRDHLAEHLPAYMLPTTYLAMDQLPTTSIGKIDKVLLLESLKQAQGAASPPSTEREVFLAEVWSLVLKCPLHQITKNSSFFELGGDSISAMQLASKLQTQGWTISNAQIFKAFQLDRMAVAMKRSTSSSQDSNEEIYGMFALAPAQQEYFARNFVTHYNQSILLQPFQTIKSSTLHSIMRTLVAHHDVLRSEFCEVQGQWKQRIKKADEFEVPKPLELSCNSAKELEQCLKTLQQSLDYQRAPLFVTALIQYQKKSLLFITFHHLIIDLVSWRILLEDFELLLRGESLPAKTSSFVAWNQALQEFLEEENNGSTQHQNKFLWSDSSHEPRQQSIRFSAAGLDQACVPFKCNIQDLILCGLVASLQKIDESFESIRVHLESHGRQSFAENINVSRTIGWFTSISPVSFSKNTDLVRLLRQVKQRIREISRVPYQSAIRSLEDIQITFNYEGKFQHLAGSSQFRKIEDIPVHDVQDGFMSEDILITGFHSGEDLVLQIDYCVGSNDFVGLVLEETKGAIVDIIDILKDGTISGFTASDFDLLPSTVHMESIEDAIKNELTIDLCKVEDIYPATPLQAGLISQMLQSRSSYVLQTVLHLQGKVDLEKLELAWRKVTQTYSILRTAFVSTENGLFQVVHNVDATNWMELFRDEEELNFQLETYLEQDRFLGFTMSDSCFCRFSYMRASDGLILIITLHHSIIDGWSTPLLLDTLWECYDNEAHINPVSFKEHVQYVLECPHSNEFWKRHLEHLPKQSLPIVGKSEKVTWNRRNGILQFDTASLIQVQQNLGITLNTVFKTAWALTLHYFLRGDSVVFGIVHSGRDSGIPGIETYLDLNLDVLDC
jgi:iturin family lipopeptide synthetase B